MIGENFYYAFAVFLVSLFALNSFQKTDLSNSLPRGFDSFWLTVADKVTTETYNYVSFIVKTILGLALSLSAPADKTR